MINTVNIKQQQLLNGYFKTGLGAKKILIMGSCRVVNLVNYFACMSEYTVYSIDPFSWNWDLQEQRTDYDAIIKDMETHTGLLKMLSECEIFIHEYYQNAGMFNVNKESEKNIYQFGMKTEIDICIPNFNDYFILTQDIVNFDVEIRKKALQDYNVIGRLSEQTLSEIKEISNRNLERFYSVCRLSDMPLMELIFKDNYLHKRFWWTYNHVTNLFTTVIFKFINELYFNGTLKRPPDEHEDMFANNYTHLTQYDTEYHWPEARINLKL